MGKQNKKKVRQAPISELLEPRVLFSADSLSVLGGALVPDEIVDTDAALNLYEDIATPVNSQTIESTEVVFIDARVPELQSFIDDISSNSSATITIVVIDQSQSGIDVIQNTLDGLENVDSIHLVSHNYGSSIRLGSDLLSHNSLDEHGSSISMWADALTDNADILIYGCDLGSSINGLNLMDGLANLTGADVAISSNITGHASVGGDWVLELSSGSIEASIIVSEQFQASWEHSLATWNSTTRVLEVTYQLDKFDNSLNKSSVDNLINSASANNSEISLREAIAAVNNESNPDNVTINLLAGEYLLDRTTNTTSEDNTILLGSNSTDISEADLDILHDLTIQGAGSGVAGTVIRADTDNINAEEFRQRVISAEGVHLNLTGLAITGGYTEYRGSGLNLDNSSAVITDVHFYNNESLEDVGGGLFSDNQAAAGLQIVDSKFSNNQSASGGGMRVNNGTPGVQVELTRVQFIGNTATELAGVAPVTPGGNGYGGGLNSNAETIIIDSVFESNNAVRGGGLYANIASDITISGTEFNSNTATENGGGIQVVGQLTLNENSLLFDNEANTSGGGAFVSIKGSLTIDSSTIEANRAMADAGGGIYKADDGTGLLLTINDSIIRSNEALNGNGGGIYSQSDLTLTNSTIHNNDAGDNGGGLFINNSANTKIDNTTFFTNEATSRGGAIEFDNSNIDIQNSTFARNHAGVDDSAIGRPDNQNSNQSRATLFNSIVSANTSDNAGQVQLATGVISNGFNVIETGSVNETNYAASFNDIIEPLGSSYTVDAKLANSLSSGAGSHSQHLRLLSGSDAIDAGAGEARLDGFGVMSNEFVDAGAVGYPVTSSSTKVYFVDEADQSVYRMNIDGRAVQQIVEPLSAINPDQKFIDIAYDNKTQQLFYIRYTAVDTGDYYDVLLSDAAGTFETNSHLELGYQDTSNPDAKRPTNFEGYTFKAPELTIQETIGSAPNRLYIASHITADEGQFNSNFFQLIEYDILEGVNDVSGVAKIWEPIPTMNYPLNFTGYMDATAFNITTVHAVTDPNSTDNAIFILGDSGNNNTVGHFYVAKESAFYGNPEIIIITDADGNRIDNSLVQSVAYNAANGISYTSLDQATLAIPSDGTATISASYERPLPLQFNDTFYVQKDENFWYSDSVDVADGGAGGVIGYTDKDLATPVEIVLEQTPASIAFAAITNVSTNPAPRVVNEEVLIVDENESEIISESFLSYKDFKDTSENISSESTAEEIHYRITQLPEHGTLSLDGTEIASTNPAPLTYHFTQQDINDGKLGYSHLGGEENSDNFNFTVSDDTSSIGGILEISVTPVNDAPSIALDRTSQTILESDDVANFGSVTITDGDSTNFTINVTDGAGNPSPYVEVNGTELFLIDGAELDHETQPTFEFFVQATDDLGAESSLEKFTVTVADVNEAPVIANAITETLTAQETVFFTYTIPDTTFFDQDVDADNSIYATGAGGSALPTWLSYDVDSKTFSGTPTDDDADKTYDLEIWATDKDTPALSSPLMPLTINVLDINQKPESIMLTTLDGTLNVPELEEGRILGTLSTDDPDKSDTENLTHTYTFANASDELRFEIIGTQLKLIDGQAFDYNLEQIVPIEIISTDTAGDSVVETFLLTVLNVDENPSFTFTNENLTVSESNTNVSFGTINATDPDPDSTPLTVLVTDVDGNPSPYAELDGSEIRPATDYDLDHETMDTFDFYLQVEDAQNLKSDRVLYTVIIEDANEPVTLSGPSFGQINENADGILNGTDGSAIAPFTVSDDDTNNAYSYSIKNTGPESDYFDVNANQELIIKPGAGFDFESTPIANAFTLTIEVFDGVNTDAIDVDIQINNVNEPPTIANAINNLAAQELALFDFTFPDNTFSDQEDGSNLAITVQMANSDPWPEWLSYDQDNARLFGTPEDNDADKTIELHVVATDTGNPALSSAIMPLTISVSDVNQKPSGISLTTLDGTFDIPELEANRVLGTLSTTDPDEADNSSTAHTYSFVNPADAERFEFDGNDIKLKFGEAFDYNDEQLVAIAIRSTDSNGESVDQTFNFNVINIDEPPTFSLSNQNLSVSETAENVIFGTVNATDPDPDSAPLNILLTDINGDPSPYVELSGNNIIQNQGFSFNFEEMSSFDFYVQVEDAQALTSENKMFSVAIIDANDAPSDITLTTVDGTLNVNELVEGLVIGTLDTSDVDDGDQNDTSHSYSFVNENDADRFEFNGNQLKLQSGNAFDFNTESNVSIDIKSTDSGGGSVEETFVLAVQNVDEPPSITLENQNLIILESDTNVTFGSINATDPDPDSNPLTISVTDEVGNPNAYVEIKDGNIQQISGVSFDHEAMDSFDFYLKAEDAQGLISPIAKYSVEIQDVNEAPVTVTNNLEIVAEEAESFSFVIPTTAFTDQDENADISLQLAMADGSALAPWLTFDQETNTLSGTPSDADANKQFAIIVSAFDGALTSPDSLELIIDVPDANQKPTSVALVGGNVLELTPNALAGTLSTNDPDRIDEQHTYSVDDARFTIVGTSLQLAPSVILDIDNDETISVNITSTDSSGESVTSPVVIVVDNKNESPIPETASVPTDVSLSTGDSLDLSNLVFVDPDNDPISYSLALESGQPLPEWIQFDEITKQITFVDDAPENITSITLIYQADDGLGGIASTPITIAISEPPVIAAAMEEIIEIVEVAPPAPTIQPTITAEPVAESKPEEAAQATTTAKANQPEEVNEGIGWDEKNESVDLASLIRPLEKVNFTEIETADNSIKTINREFSIVGMDSIDTHIDWLDLSDAFNQPSDTEFVELAYEFDRQREELAEQAANSKTLIGSTFTLSSGFSVGYLLWLIRGGTLMGSVLSSLPAWRLVDPLPVLGSLGDDLSDDDESLESMVDNKEEDSDHPDQPSKEAA